MDIQSIEPPSIMQLFLGSSIFLHLCSWFYNGEGSKSRKLWETHRNKWEKRESLQPLLVPNNALIRGWDNPEKFSEQALEWLLHVVPKFIQQKHHLYWNVWSAFYYGSHPLMGGKWIPVDWFGLENPVESSPLSISISILMMTKSCSPRWIL